MSTVEFIQKNIWLVLIAIVSGLMFVWPTIAKRFSRTREVGASEAVQLINRRDAVIVDVREVNEFKDGHIPNARNIPLSTFSARTKDLEKLKSKPVLVVCASGNRSTTAYAELKKLGVEDVYALAGGMQAWQQASMPVEKA
ncbi:MAG TPA: rhodanese-like domain-containing protein [Burkholderiales bacterium]|nr:rhodanese-like domain-containing protein [Burkholderiales bacterium]